MDDEKVADEDLITQARGMAAELLADGYKGVSWVVTMLADAHTALLEQLRTAEARAVVCEHQSANYLRMMEQRDAAEVRAAEAEAERGQLARGQYALAAKIAEAVEEPHTDTCGSMLGDYPCNCFRVILDSDSLTLLARVKAEAAAEAWDEGALWAYEEITGEPEKQFQLAPGDNPHRKETP